MDTLAEDVVAMLASDAPLRPCPGEAGGSQGGRLSIAVGSLRDHPTLFFWKSVKQRTLRNPTKPLCTRLYRVFYRLSDYLICSKIWGRLVLKISPLGASKACTKGAFHGYFFSPVRSVRREPAGSHSSPECPPSYGSNLQATWS